jgi:hypothetical protein
MASRLSRQLGIDRNVRATKSVLGLFLSYDLP